MMVTRRPGRASLSPRRFLRVLSRAMLAIRECSQERCAHQATICRESGAADHRQAQAGALVEGFPMPQLESASTAAIRATRLEVILPRPARARDGRRRMFQQRRPHLEAILPPACGFEAASRASPPIAARSSSPLHRFLQSLSLAPHVSLSRHTRGSART